MTTISNGTTTVEPAVVLDYAYTRAARTIVHDVLDDRGDPDVTLRPVSTRAGRLRMLCPSRALAADVEALHMHRGTLQLVDDQEPTADMAYVVVGDVAVDYDATQDVWTVDAGYREVLP